MISNFPTDIEKKVDHIIITLPFNDLSLKNQLKNIIPSESELLTKGNALKVRVLPNDAGIDNRQSKSKPGNYWNFNFNCDVVDNTHSNFQRLNFFSNRKIVLVVGTSTYRYQLGNQDHPLDFSFKETTTGFNISIAGQCFCAASRQKISSFITTS